MKTSGLIEAGLGVQTHLLDNNLEIEGEAENVTRAANILEDYNTLLREGHVFNNGDLNSYLRVVTNDREVSLRALVNSGKQRNFGKKVLAPKTVNQRRYLEAIERNDLVFGIGPAGTGKTYLAVAMAISALMNKQVARIVLTRPAVEAGERLGFLPGTLQEKVDPYLRPLYDALYDMLDSERVEKLLERNVIEVAPIAFMRGRTLNDSFIILDEAQNCTPEQMKMVLTRQGFNSKMVVNGDVTQIDLPAGRRSGLIDATEVLRGVEGISFVQFDDKDVVRHTLVQRIVKAYERYNEAIGAARQLTLPLAEPFRRRERQRERRGQGGDSVRRGRPAGLKRAMSSPEGSSVTFRRVPASLRRAPIERFARTLQKEVVKGRSFDTLITGDAELRRLNRDFRGKDYATDVLSFPAIADQSRDRQGALLPRRHRHLPGRARAQAREFGHAIEQEVQILMLHGVLHLMGHDHETDSGAMARAEKRWRAKLGLPNGLIERVRS